MKKIKSLVSNLFKIYRVKKIDKILNFRKI